MSYHDIRQIGLGNSTRVDPDDKTVPSGSMHLLDAFTYCMVKPLVFKV